MFVSYFKEDTKVSPDDAFFFFVLFIANFLDENRMPHVENRMRNATHFDDCPHDASVFSRLPWG